MLFEVDSPLFNVDETARTWETPGSRKDKQEAKREAIHNARYETNTSTPRGIPPREGKGRLM